MIDKKNFKKNIGGLFEKAGFVKKGPSWYFDGKDALVVANLEKIDMFSNNQYVINIGIWLKAFGESMFPEYNQCHLYYRVERLFPSERELILKSCSLTDANEQLLIDLDEFIRNKLIPFLKECTDVRKLRELLAESVLKKGFMMQEARIFLTGE